MTRQQILEYAKKKYSTSPENLWIRYPDYQVLRHSGGEKWYGIIMDVTPDKIGLKGDGKTDILVLKGRADDIVHITEMKGFAPAYHMNKKHWFTVILGDLTEENADTVYAMLDRSYDMTR